MSIAPARTTTMPRPPLNVLPVTSRPPNVLMVARGGVRRARAGEPAAGRGADRPGRFSYEFTVKDPPGTYMYHSHFDSAEEVGRGLYGAFIVQPTHVT